MTGPRRQPQGRGWEAAIACVVVFGCAAGWARATNTLYAVDFESPDVLAGWDLQSTGQGVIERRVFDGDPNTWLLLHDGVDDGAYSYNTASFTISVNRMTDLVLSFAARSFDAEGHLFDEAAPGYDGVTVELTVSGAVHVRRLVDGAFDVFHAFDLGALGFPPTPQFYQDLKVRFHQYGNASAPADGIAIDDIRVTGRPYWYVVVVAPAEIEEAVGTIELTVALQPPPTEDRTLTVELPGTAQEAFEIVYPAGAPVLFFSVPFPDDDISNGDRIQTVEVLCEDYATGIAEMSVIDEEMHRVSLRFSGDLVEGDTDARGSVRLNFTVAEPTPIHLTSSDPSVLSVPETVLIDAGRSSASFSAVAPDDEFHRPNQLVTITAILPGEHTNSLTVSVVDNDPVNLVLAGPTTAFEGQTGLVYRVDLGARLHDDLELDVQGFPAGELLHPPTVTVPAGERFAEFLVSVADDDLLTTDRYDVLRVSNAAFGSHQISVQVLDNDIAGYRIVGISQLIAAGKDRPFEVWGVDFDGEPAPYFNGSVEVFLVDGEGTETALYPGPVTLANGVFAGTFQAPSSGSGYRIRVRDAVGRTAESDLFDLYFHMPFDARDLTYDPVTAKLYVTAGADAPPGHADAVTPVDPFSLTLEDPLYVGPGLGRIESTDGGEYLYVAVNGQRVVRRIDLQNFSLDMSIALVDPDFPTREFTARNLLTFPGRPRDVLVAQDHAGSNYTVSPIYFDGVAQRSLEEDAWELAPAGDPNQFYAYDSTTTSATFWRMELTVSGYKSVAESRELVAGFNTRIAGEGDLVFTSGGRIIDGLNMTQIGYLPFPSSWYNVAPAAIATDLAHARVYCAKGNEIASFEAYALSRLEIRQLDDIAGRITRIIRWGPRGLAMLTNEGDLLILESASLLPSGDPTDLSVRVSPSRNPAEYGVPLTYQVTVDNHGPLPAERVELSVDVGEAQELLSVTGNVGRIAIEGPLLEVTHVGLGVGEQMQVTIEALPIALSPLLVEAGVVLSRTDENPANNWVRSVVSVGYASAPDTVRVLEVNADIVLWEPVSERLLFNHDNGSSAHRILSLDPLTGWVDQAYVLHEFPGAMAVSDDGQYLYIGIGSPPKITRVHLDTWESDLDFASSTPNDIKVLPGSPRAVSVASNVGGVRIYDDGVQRPNTTRIHDCNRVEVSPDPAVIYAYHNSRFDTFRLGIDESGVHILQERSSLFNNYPARIKSDGHFLYTNSGRAIDGETLTLHGEFEPFQGGDRGFEPERARQRVYYGSGTSILSYDAASYQQVRGVDFPDVPDNIVRLERWGEDGFAALLENGHLAIIRTDLVPQGEPSAIDLVVWEPAEGRTIAASEFTVRGGAWGPEGIGQVMVNGVAADTEDGYANWSHAIALSVGTNWIEVAAAGAEPDAETKTHVVMVIHVPAEDGDGDGIADAWEELHFPGQAVEDILPGSNDDGDFSTLLEEYLLGQDPGASDQPFVLRLDEDAPGRLIVGYARLRDAPWTYHLEYAVDQDTWHDAAAILQPAGPPVVLPGARHEVVTYTLAPFSPRQAAFRVRVAPAP